MLSRLTRYLPTAETVRQNPALKGFNRFLHDPWLWHFRRRSVARAFAIGLFCAMLPLPIQSYIAIALFIFFRANLPLGLALVWVTNPFTIPPIFYVAFLIGQQILGGSYQDIAPISLSWEWFSENAAEIFLPLLVGTQVIGVSLALLSFAAVHWSWAYTIHHKRRQRRTARRVPPT